jgi:hypothetical protein
MFASPIPINCCKDTPKYFCSAFRGDLTQFEAMFFISFSKNKQKPYDKFKNENSRQNQLNSFSIHKQLDILQVPDSGKRISKCFLVYFFVFQGFTFPLEFPFEFPLEGAPFDGGAVVFFATGALPVLVDLFIPGLFTLLAGTAIAFEL